MTWYTTTALDGGLRELSLYSWGATRRKQTPPIPPTPLVSYSLLLFHESKNENRLFPQVLLLLFFMYRYRFCICIYMALGGQLRSAAPSSLSERHGIALLEPCASAWPKTLFFSCVLVSLIFFPFFLVSQKGSAGVLVLAVYMYMIDPPAFTPFATTPLPLLSHLWAA